MKLPFWLVGRTSYFSTNKSTRFCVALKDRHSGTGLSPLVFVSQGEPGTDNTTPGSKGEPGNPGLPVRKAKPAGGGALEEAGLWRRRGSG